MSREQFEEELRSRMKDYKPAVDTQQLWSNIKKEKSKNYTGIIAFILLLMGTGVGAFFLLQNQNEESVVTNTNTNTTITAIEQSNDVEVKRNIVDAKTTNINQEILANKNINEVNSKGSYNTKSNVVENQVASLNDRNKRQLSSKALDQSTTAAKSENLIKSTNTDLQVNNLDYANASNTVLKNNKNVLENKIESDIENSIINQTDDSYSKDVDHRDVVVNNGTEVISSRGSYLAQNFYKRQNESNLSQVNSADFESYLLKERVGEEQVSNWIKMDGVTKKRKPSDSRKQKKYKSPKKTFAISVEALVGPMFPFRKLSEKSIEETSYLSQRLFTEKVLRGYKAELNTYGNFKKYGYFRVGIDYAGFKESFIYNGETTSEYWDPDGIASVQINGDGDTTYVVDSVLVTQVVERDINRVNTYNMLDLSVSMGFILNRDKWSIFVDGGIAYNLMFNARGQYLNEDLQVVYFEDEQVSGGLPLRNNLGPAVVGNFGFTYKINKNLDFKIKSGYKRYFNDFSSNENPLSQKYNFINLGLGIQYTFNNY